MNISIEVEYTQSWFGKVNKTITGEDIQKYLETHPFPKQKTYLEDEVEYVMSLALRKLQFIDKVFLANLVDCQGNRFLFNE